MEGMIIRSTVETFFQAAYVVDNRDAQEMVGYLELASKR
jgi:hypothetical protein